MNNIELATAIKAELATVEMADEANGPRGNRGKMDGATREAWEQLVKLLEGPQPSEVDLPYAYIERNCLGHLWNTRIYAVDFARHYA